VPSCTHRRHSLWALSSGDTNAHELVSLCVQQLVTNKAKKATVMSYYKIENKKQQRPTHKSNTLPAPTHGRRFGCQTLAFLADALTSVISFCNFDSKKPKLFIVILEASP
jgi:hypothetical protein